MPPSSRKPSPPKKGAVIKLSREWTLGDQIGQGGFGRVFAASSGGTEAVVKLVPKDPGAERELLFVNLGDARNVVPIIENGEYGDFWALVMPRAEMSLREYIDSSGDRLNLMETIAVLKDVCDTLADLEASVVHRDLKPQNILRLGGHWCLADFGIARYAEATTAPDTQKFALSPPYAAPERWRMEHATSAADIYAFGVMAYEMVAGALPFSGPDFRHQHLHDDPPRLADAPPAFGSLVDECLYKAPQARPRAANICARPDKVSGAAGSPGLARLQEVNREEVRRRGEGSREQSAARSEAERREVLAATAQKAFDQISAGLHDAITEAAPAAVASAARGGGWTLKLNRAELTLSAMKRHGIGQVAEFDVVCSASLNLTVPQDYYGYSGRSHSLWFGDVQVAGQYGWYETAFMHHPLSGHMSTHTPFSLDPGAEAARAVGSGINEFAVAWPFTPLVVGDLDGFIDRWATWFANAAQGHLQRPGEMPERRPEGSWRR
jgi:serine/threonine-protein kinase